MDYATWVAQIQAEGGTATALPFDLPFAPKGVVAARYPVVLYVQLFNAGQIDPNAPQATTANGQYVYVAAPADLTNVPATMTLLQRIENTVFTEGDAAAGAVGLPSLDSIQNFLKDTGKQILIGVGVTLAVAYLIRRKRA